MNLTFSVVKLKGFCDWCDQIFFTTRRSRKLKEYWKNIYIHLQVVFIDYANLTKAEKRVQDRHNNDRLTSQQSRPAACRQSSLEKDTSVPEPRNRKRTTTIPRSELQHAFVAFLGSRSRSSSKRDASTVLLLHGTTGATDATNNVPSRGEQLYQSERVRVTQGRRTTIVWPNMAMFPLKGLVFFPLLQEIHFNFIF